MIICTTRPQRAKQTYHNVPTCRRRRKWYLWSVSVMHHTQFHLFNWHNIGRKSLTMQTCCPRVMRFSQGYHPIPLRILWRFSMASNHTFPRKSLMIWCCWCEFGYNRLIASLASQERSPGARKIDMIYYKNSIGKQKYNNRNQFSVATRFPSCTVKHRELQNDPRDSLKESCWNLKRWPN
jgi:hypothetical protein